ncbi:unnamed protein product [Effrenium voratum]|uniref:Centrosomal protein of 19 kDa n=1 Tax=Effrenium voratum TaxID=2562239 RepID=A0AA36NAA3_9DINO|nr:unnamed protein product [Effrenium voratum]
MSTPELEPGEVCPRRFGLNYDPPAIILEYLEVSTGKLFHRKVGLKRLRAGTDPARVAEKLRQSNRPLLTEDRRAGGKPRLEPRARGLQVLGLSPLPSGHKSFTLLL